VGRVRAIPNVVSEVKTIDRTLVTDGGLPHLKGLTKLRVLDLTRTQVSDKGVADLKQALPDAEIVR
jgi:hypothetical protein